MLWRWTTNFDRLQAVALVWQEGVAMLLIRHGRAPACDQCVQLGNVQNFVQRTSCGCGDVRCSLAIFFGILDYVHEVFSTMRL